MDDARHDLHSPETGVSPKAAELLPLAYEELGRLAAHLLSREKPGQTLQATALVHEAWLCLAGAGQTESRWESRRHFFGAAAEAMRRILVENATPSMPRYTSRREPFRANSRNSRMGVGAGAHDSACKEQGRCPACPLVGASAPGW